MPRCQIRTEYMSLETLLKNVSLKAWDAIQEELIQEEIEPDSYSRFHKRIHEGVAPYIRAYRLCGLSHHCTEDITSAPLSEEPGKIDITPWDYIFHLFISADLTDYIDSLAFDALDSVLHLMRSGYIRKTFQLLRDAIRQELGKYVFDNPSCGLLELCHDWRSVTISPWNFG